MAFLTDKTRLNYSKREALNEELAARLIGQEADLGNTDLASALAPLYAYAAASPGRLRNVLLFSDGRVTALDSLLSLVQRSAQYMRLFCFGTGSDVAAHTLRMLARWGGGTYVQMDWYTEFSQRQETYAMMMQDV